MRLFSPRTFAVARGFHRLAYLHRRLAKTEVILVMIEIKQVRVRDPHKILNLYSLFAATRMLSINSNNYKASACLLRFHICLFKYFPPSVIKLDSGNK